MIEHMTDYGYHIGMAFQIVDDILDFTSEENTIGKPVGTDLKQGLITLPILEYIEKFPDDPDATTIRRGKCLEGDHQIARFIETVRSSGAIEIAMEKAHEHILLAIQALHHHPFTKERQALEELALYIIQRNI